MRTTPVTIALVAALAAISAAAQDDCRGIGGGPIIQAFVPGRVIVVPRLGAAIYDLNDRFYSKPWTTDPLGETGAFRIDSARYSTRQLKEIFNDPFRYSYVDSDYYIEAHCPSRLIEPNDPEFTFADHAWGLKAIGAPEAWAFGQGRRSVVVAIVDSGIFFPHPDLKDNLFHAARNMQISVNGQNVQCLAGDSGYDGVGGDCQAEARTDHGTSVAGIVGASGDNDEGVTGVNWHVSLLPVTLLDEANRGCESRAVKALEFARRVNEARSPRIRVVNLSWGNNHNSALMERELKKLADGGAVIVASAGNGGHDNDALPVYPAGFKSIPTLIAVAATDPNRRILGSSNRGFKSVDIAAPGLNIFTTFANESIPYRDASRTSMAAPFVTGAVALLASQCPNVDAVRIREFILRKADKVKALKPFVAKGRFLNIAKAAAACRAAEQRLTSR